MATQGSHDNKRVQVYWELGKALQELRKLGDPVTELGEALTALGRALRSLQAAAEIAKPTEHEWSDEKGRHRTVSRNGLPRRIQGRAATLARMVEALAREVKGLPITPEQKLLAKVTRAKARVKKEAHSGGSQR